MAVETPEAQAGDSGPALLEVAGVGKSFAGVRVLSDIDLTLRRGEVLMLVGENGAGKSTLKNILSGMLPPDTGRIAFNGVAYSALTASDADRLGIGTIHQELSLFGNLSVAENIHIPHIPSRNGFVDRKAMEAASRTLLTDVLGTAIDPRARVEQLSLGERQLVEIAKAIHRSSALLILDEPTTCLSLPERQRLFQVVARLRGSGYGIIYITHFMEEVYALADRIIVLRDGAVVATGTAAEIPRQRLGQLMVGREITDAVERPPAVRPDAAVALAARDLADESLVQDVSFEVRAGEILGLAGLMGAGRSEVAELLVGLREGSGSVTLAGQSFDRRSPRRALARGLVLVSEDRRQDQAFLSRPLRENMTSPIIARFAKGPLAMLSGGPELRLAESMTSEFSVQHPGLAALMGTLSGGNQQKAIIGRWLHVQPAVCILDEPTKGVDIGARSAVHRIIRAEAANGVAFILISSDMPELLELSHRVLVLHKGRLVGEFAREQAEPQRILELASTGRAA